MAVYGSAYLAKMVGQEKAGKNFLFRSKLFPDKKPFWKW